MNDFEAMINEKGTNSLKMSDQSDSMKQSSTYPRLPLGQTPSFAPGHTHFDILK